jgi:hypothetical protein
MPREELPRLEVGSPETIQPEVPPTLRELRDILKSPQLRWHGATLLTARSGLRSTFLASRRGPPVLVLHLKYTNPRDLDLELLRFRRTPFRVKVPVSLS